MKNITITLFLLLSFFLGIQKPIYSLDFTKKEYDILTKVYKEKNISSTYLNSMIKEAQKIKNTTIITQDQLRMVLKAGVPNNKLKKICLTLAKEIANFCNQEEYKTTQRRVLIDFILDTITTLLNSKEFENS